MLYHLHGRLTLNVTHNPISARRLRSRYRPIYLLSETGNLFERILMSLLSDHLRNVVRTFTGICWFPCQKVYHRRHRTC